MLGATSKERQMTYKPTIDLDKSPVYLTIANYGTFGIEGGCDPQRTKNCVARDISNGDGEHIVQIFELFEGRASDVTKDIADLIMKMPLDDICDSAADFVGQYNWDLMELKAEANQAASIRDREERGRI